ncbi:hypothetical protein F0344_33900 [Streptomyces finlayi]|uniref:Uncharacterized protein n=1 Tax=Streptomyces finlayi TaxID=67296 RepID=A0A7G7BUA7_9ACTN|nr:hypothetical protein [Streptomyces finlayi]QNE78922.1 hypothetical protein F0344_33900 [Streptomyces finlayi]
MTANDNRRPTEYIRFQAVAPNERGHFTGVFGLVNNLGRSGRLSAAEEHFRLLANKWFDEAYPDPSTVDPTVYDPAVNPGAAAWFKETATHLLERVDGYLDVLRTHGIACETLRSAAPGRVVYEDDVQIVVVPHLRSADPWQPCHCHHQ